MDPLVWWLILFGLIILIAAISLHLCFSLIGDKIKKCLQFGTNSTSSRTTPTTSSKLTRYQFQKTDVEDLTSIQRHFGHINSPISFVDEFKPTTFGTAATPSGSPRAVKKRKGSLLTDVHESIERFGSFYSIEGIMGDISSEKEEKKSGDLPSRRFSLVTEGMRRNSLASMPRKFSLKPDSRDESSDTLNYDDPVTVETLGTIAQLEDQAHRLDYEIDYFLGNSKNLKFYELNEKLIRLNLALSQLDCGNEELMQRKREVQVYINHSKEKLHSKVA